MEQSAPWDMPAGDQVDPEEDLRDEEAELEAGAIGFRQKTVHVGFCDCVPRRVRLALDRPSVTGGRFRD